MLTCPDMERHKPSSPKAKIKATRLYANNHHGGVEALLVDQVKTPSLERCEHATAWIKNSPEFPTTGR